MGNMGALLVLRRMAALMCRGPGLRSVCGNGRVKRIVSFVASVLTSPGWLRWHASARYLLARASIQIASLIGATAAVFQPA